MAERIILGTRLDIKYKAKENPYTIYRALNIINSNSKGLYFCTVRGFRFISESGCLIDTELTTYGDECIRWLEVLILPYRVASTINSRIKLSFIKNCPYHRAGGYYQNGQGA